MSQAGYWPSAWPVECGANHRPKTVPTEGLNLQPTDRLEATTRHTGQWPVMFVQRDRGELFLHGTTMGTEEPVSGWVERVDPISLETMRRSPDLPAGGHEWCGSVAVHANGDLYTVNGSYIHRLDPTCSIVAEQELPADHAHNGLLILADGSIITKDIRIGDVPSTLTVLDQDLQILTSMELPEASMGRLAVGEDGYIYVPGSTRLFRFSWDGAGLRRDGSWEPTYRRADRGGLAWDTTISNGRVWLMDNGNVPGIETRFSEIPAKRSGPGAPGHNLGIPPTWSEAVRAIGISVDDDGDVIELVPTEHPGGWVIAPPLVSDDVVVAWDTGNMGIAAFDLSGGPGGSGGAGGAAGEMLWFQPFRPSMHAMLYPSTHELVINDFRMLADNETSDDLVVLDIRTGQMKARVPTGATRLNAMFLCPGWQRDLYYCTSGTVARIRVESL